jgi:hypothetical protein
MTEPGADLAGLHSLLNLHRWTDIDDWVRAVRALADLSDAEIERLAAPHPLRQETAGTTGRGR